MSRQIIILLTILLEQHIKALSAFGANADGGVDCIRRNWNDACDEAKMTQVDREFLWKRQFLNSYAFADNEDRLSGLY